MAKELDKRQTPKPAAASSPQVAAPADSDPGRRPPQGTGVGTKPFSHGAQPRYVKYNIATKVLADPVARTRFSQPYSGQRRLWQD